MTASNNATPTFIKVVIRDHQSDRWLQGTNPQKIIIANSTSQIFPALQEAEIWVNTHKGVAVGFITYEASSAFNSILETHTPQSTLPLLHFALFDHLDPLPTLTLQSSDAYQLTPWQPDITEADYQIAIAQIKDEISCGNTYQVNFTFRLRSQFQGNPWPLFVDLVRGQTTPYCAYIETDQFAICSASPELFFKKSGDLIELRPMKGTIARGRTLAEDIAHQTQLQQSPKDQAENLMIVDMIRNDIGQIARLGSVQVPSLFDVERYPSIYQMTSTVTAKCDRSLVETMEALFPCASITGAPKASTMEIISRLETSPRGIYTGCIGSIWPKGRSLFNVAIRTVAINRQTGEAEYGVGSGVVWDSITDHEYAECIEKAKVLTQPQPEFSLLESILWESESGFFLLESHIDRLLNSVEYFQVSLQRSELEASIEEIDRKLGDRHSNASYKVRLLVDTSGTIHHEAQPIDPTATSDQIQLCIADQPIDSRNIFLFHKTTHRDIYTHFKSQNPNADDVILWNERGEVTEGTYGNIAVRFADQWLTPPVESGLLAGIYRRYLLETGVLEEKVISLKDLRQCDEIMWMNSIRRSRPATILNLSDFHMSDV